jgi:hypothetical protein
VESSVCDYVRVDVEKAVIAWSVGNACIEKSFIQEVTTSYKTRVGKIE